jgi:hypothetical protein
VLRQILAHLGEGRPWTVEALADELDTTTEVVLLAIEDLVQRGYLRPVGASCGGACSSCSMAAGCVKGLSSPSRAWTRTVVS